MAYVGTPEFESRRAAFTAEVRERRVAFERELALQEAITAPPASVMSPEEFVSRLALDKLPEE